MQQVVQSFKTGKLEVEEVPAPTARPGYVVVRNRFSLISTGTEGGTVKLGEMNLLQKARARPEQVQKVFNVVRTDGLLAAYRAVTRTLEMPIALGYCCAGQVLETGRGVDDLSPGQAVACGGAGWANHAEVVCVPRNLVVALPDGVSTRHGAFTTLGSIAMQGVRIADVRLGESVVVIGLGLVGLLVAQILRAGGCRVFGIDVDPDRLRLAKGEGYCEGALRSCANLVEQVRAFTSGHLADAVVITAATAKNDPVALAGELVRKKARVVVVGRTQMLAPRETYLFKELELCTSLAYGPGTGDPEYEDRGIDYPLPYVRWTENRNMQAFVQLIADGSLALDSMISHELGIAEAARAFDLVTGKTEEKPLAVLLRYPDTEETPTRRIELGPIAPADPGDLGISVIGAGSFASNFIVPLLAKTPGVHLHGIASANGLRARALGDQYGFQICSSDGEVLARDKANDGVVILTRHDSHASLTLEALAAGKHVFVEKPLAMTVEDLAAIVRAAADAQRMVQVGFNRRFAPLAVKMKAFFADRRQPMSITFRSNVGYRPPEHWLHDAEQGGGVILGEAVHFVDFCHWLIGAAPVEVRTIAVRGERTGVINADNVHIGLSFADGSIATIVYVSNGDPSLSRESVEVFAEGGAAILEDFRRLTLSRRGRRRVFRRLQDRGHAQQMSAMVEAWRKGSEALPLAESALSSLATLMAVASLQEREIRAIRVCDIGLQPPER